jgi:hypothetical protein
VTYELVHVRVGPGMDVACCGEKGHKLKFTIVLKEATCPGCIARRRKTMKAAKPMVTTAIEVDGAQFVARYGRIK